MPIDPMIARGIPQPNPANALAGVAALRQRDQALAQDAQQNFLMQQRFDRASSLQENALAAEEKRARREQAGPILYQAAKAGDPRAMEIARAMAIEDFPQLAEMPPEVANQAIMQGLEKTYGAPPAPQVQDLGQGWQAVMQGSDIIGSPRPPPQPQQYGPESFSAELDDQGNILLVGNRGTIRETGRKGSKGSSGAGVTIGPNGELMVNPDPSKATEGERTSSNYADRMRAAEALLGSYTPNAKEYMAARMVMQSGPIVASGANKYLSPEGQTYYQAASDWVRAKLRKESGAVISPQEMEQEIKTYFPLPNDAPGTISQKKAAREQALSGMRQMAGRAASPVASSKDDPLGLR
jgi:hypothetical protein